MIRVVALALAALALAGCESNYARDKRIAARGQRLMASAGTVALGPASRDVHVERALLVRGGDTLAAVVELHNDSPRAQGALPLRIDVRGAGGASVYSNDLQGLQPALQRVALVPAGQTAWWVDDQLLGVTTAHSVSARVGRGTALARAPRVALRDLHYVTDSDGTYLAGTVDNRSGATQANLPVFAVALRGRRVVAAGRAIVLKAPAAGAGKPAHFRVIFVGDPKGAHVQLTVAPTAPGKDAGR